MTMNDAADLADLVRERAGGQISRGLAELIVYAAHGIALGTLGRPVCRDPFLAAEDGPRLPTAAPAFAEESMRYGDGAQVDLLGRTAVEMAIRRYGDTAETVLRVAMKDARGAWHAARAAGLGEIRDADLAAQFSGTPVR